MISNRMRLILMFIACLVPCLLLLGANAAIGVPASTRQLSAAMGYAAGNTGVSKAADNPPSPSVTTGITFNLYSPLQALLIAGFPPPTNYKFLAWKVGDGTAADAASYYELNANVKLNLTNGTCSGQKCTLHGWKTANGFDTGTDTSAVYYNAGDLGLGREMHCKRNPADTAAIACYVTNYGPNFPPAADPAAALSNAISRTAPIATVAMEFVPSRLSNPGVRFYVYLHTGNSDSTDGDVLVPTAALDSEGQKNVPQVCMSCHGGSYAAGKVKDASFLPFDVTSFSYDNRLFSAPLFTTTVEVPLYSLAFQQENFRKLNSLVKATRLITDSIAGFIDDLYEPCSVDSPGCKSAFSPDNPMPAPPGWKMKPKLYSLVVAPYCRTCHLAQRPEIDWTNFDPFDSAAIESYVCQTNPNNRVPHRMPNAEVSYKKFWSSSGAAAREYLAQVMQFGHCRY